jgi:hypothetical protein
MPHQEALTVIAKIRDGQVAPLQKLLGNIRDGRDPSGIVPFAKLPRVHFARFMVFEATHDLEGNPLPPQVAFLTNVDAPLDAHFRELATVCGDGIDAVFAHCEGYPAAGARSPDARERFLRSHFFKSDAVHINRRGRSVAQIHQDEGLRRELDRFLDDNNFTGSTPATVKERITSFVRGRADLAWALQPPEPPALGWRVKEQLHKILSILLVVVLSPLLLLGLPVFLFVLRRHEKRDVPDESAAEPAVIRAFRDDEDFWPQNQVVAAGLFKPGLFRKLLARTLLATADFATRHIYNRGILSGLNTIHFARWVTFDDGRRLFFTSNYDGSLEAYMNDFIDKAAWGLNAIFTSGDGFPPTAFLFCLGITNEKRYKRFLPTRQVPTNVWYSAYPQLTTKNIANNEAMRLGLSQSMSDAETRLWLKRFGCGNQLPESGWAARLLDGIQWDKVCRFCK